MALCKPEHYVEAFKTFREKSGELRKIAETLQFCFPSIIPKLEHQAKTCHQLNVLSVGSGSGEMDIEILKILREEVQKFEDCQNMKIYNCAIEPNEYFLSLYKDAIKQGEGQKMTLDRESGVVFELLENTFEQFSQNTIVSNVKFDIIHFIHSIYYVDIEQTLVHCFDKMLHQNGVVMCVVMGADSLNYKVYYKANKRSLDQNSITEKVNVKIRMIAEKYKCKYEVHSKTYNYDVSEMLDENSKSGNLLFDFMTQGIDFRSTMDKSVVQETMDVIREMTFVGENGKHFGTIYLHFLFIYK